MDIKEIWEADRLRTERVRAIEVVGALDVALEDALGDERGDWWDASTSRSVTMAALSSFHARHPDRMEAFAQRLLDEVAPWATLYDRAIELDGYDLEARKERGLGSATVLRILTTKPAAIVRALILALPERGGEP